LSFAHSVRTNRKKHDKLARTAPENSLDWRYRQLLDYNSVKTKLNRNFLLKIHFHLKKIAERKANKRPKGFGDDSSLFISFILFVNYNI